MLVLQMYIISCQWKHLKQGKILTVCCIEPDTLSSTNKAKADKKKVNKWKKGT